MLTAALLERAENGKQMSINNGINTTQSPCAAAAAKSLQSCLTLCDPIDSSPPGSPVLGFSRQEHWSGLRKITIIIHRVLLLLSMDKYSLNEKHQIQVICMCLHTYVHTCMQSNVFKHTHTHIHTYIDSMYDLKHKCSHSLEMNAQMVQCEEYQVLSYL